jgi:hypothetical protein
VLRLTVPQRILDTRTWKPAGLKSGWQDDLVIDYGAAIDQGMTAAMVTVTAVRPTGGGYVSAFDPDRDPRTTSTLNLHPGVTTPNLAVVPTTICESGPCAGLPIISVYNGSPKATNILVDIVGVFSSTGGQYGLRYHAVTPTRIADTRYHRGASPLAAHSTTVIQTPPAVAGYWTGAVVANVTAIQPTASTYLTLWSNDGRVKPSISSSNPSALTTVANSTMTEIADDSTFDIYNSSGTTNVAIDVAGTFEFLPSDFPALSPQASGGVHAPLPRLLKAVGATPSAGRPHPAKR